jgi:hypothetical protein
MLPFLCQQLDPVYPRQYAAYNRVGFINELCEHMDILAADKFLKRLRQPI